jgi:hypothetical protein
MSQTVVEQRPLPAGQGETSRVKRVRSEALIERDIAVYKRHMSGLSVRAICDEFNIKSTQTIHAAIQRGRQYAIERGIDAEEHRLEINELFRDTLVKLHAQVSYQAEHGQEEFFVDQDGNKSMKRRKGIDPRIAGELSRSLHRWAEFLGLMERAPEVNQASTTLIQLSAPADGASFGSKWAGDAVDVSPIAAGDNHPAVEAGGQPVNSAVLMRATAAGPADLAQNPAQNPDSPTHSGRRRG